MKTKKHLLVADSLGKDREASAREALLRTSAGAFAREIGVSGSLLHVESLTKFGEPNIAFLFKKTRAEMVKRLRKHADQIKFTAILKVGDPVAEILRLGVPARHCESIALATHGRKGVMRMILGSVSEEVIRNSKVPVFVHGPRVSKGWRKAVRAERAKIVIGTDFSASSRRAENYAIDLAVRLNAEVHLVHCLQEGFHPVLQTAFQAPGRPKEINEWRESLRAEALTSLNRLAKKFNEKGVTTQQFLDEKSEKASATVLARVKSAGADLVVLGTHGRNFVAGAVLGRCARKVILESTVPVITVR